MASFGACRRGAPEAASMPALCRGGCITDPGLLSPPAASIGRSAQAMMPHRMSHRLESIAPAGDLFRPAPTAGRRAAGRREGMSWRRHLRKTAGSRRSLSNGLTPSAQPCSRRKAALHLAPLASSSLQCQITPTAPERQRVFQRLLLLPEPRKSAATPSSSLGSPPPLSPADHRSSADRETRPCIRAAGAPSCRG